MDELYGSNPALKQLRKEADAYMADGNPVAAFLCLSEAMQKSSKPIPALLALRSKALLKAGNFYYALSDADEVIRYFLTFPAETNAMFM